MNYIVSYNHIDYFGNPQTQYLVFDNLDDVGWHIMRLEECSAVEDIKIFKINDYTDITKQIVKD